MDKVTHTPVKACLSVDGDLLAVYPDTGRQEFPICKMPDYVSAAVNKAKADRIMLAWNCHDDMIEAFKMILERDATRIEDIHAIARAALAKATPASPASLKTTGFSGEGFRS